MDFPKSLLLILALAFFIRAFPLFAGSMTGPDPWFHARMSEMVVEQQAIPKYDPLSMQGRNYSYAPLFHTLIATFSIATGIQVISITPLLPLIYGSMAVFLLFIFARRLFKNNAIALFAALAIAVMPLHLARTASYARPDSLALLIVPTIIYLIYLKRFTPASLLTIGLVLLHPLSSAYLFIFLIGWMIVAKVRKIEFQFSKTFALILVGVLVWLLWLYSLPYHFSEYISMVSFESVENTKPLIISFFVYFSFSWIFLTIGLIKFNAKKHIFLLSWFLFSLLYGAFSYRLFIFLSIPFALIAAYGFGWVFTKTRKYFPVLLFLLFVLAFLVVFQESQIGAHIKPGEKAAMNWIKASTDEQAVIGCRWDSGHPLTYLSRRAVMIDGYFEFAPRLDERNESMKNLITSSDCNKLLFEKQKWDVNYFYVPVAYFYSFENGLLEADCNFISRQYDSGQAIVLGFD